MSDELNDDKNRHNTYFYELLCDKIFLIEWRSNMIISYNEFYDMLVKFIETGQDFYKSLLVNIIKNPSRYCGLFRLSNAKTKLIQNVTQSNEIKFGDIIEELTTEYIERLGYKTFEKNLGRDENGDELNVDQYFTDGSTLFIVEMKIRDDHDSTKKRGQYANFQKKIRLIRRRHPNSHIEASMWFVDDSLVKNKNYYRDEMSKEHFDNCKLHLFYGGEFFATLKGGKQAWEELTEILTEYRINSANNDVDIPDFGSSEEIYMALLELPSNYWKRLTSDDPQYILLRKELFSNGDNIEKAKIERNRRFGYRH